MANPNVKVWICGDCDFIFQTYSKAPAGRNSFFCPDCGENISVKRYKKTNKKKSPRRFWTDGEMETLKQVLDGKLMVYQAAVKLGRTNKSVSRRVDRMKEEANS